MSSGGEKQVRSRQKSNFWNTGEWILVWNVRDEKQRLFRLFCNNKRKRELGVKSRTWPWGRQSLPEFGITGIPEGMICSTENQPWYIQFRKHALSTN